MTVMAARPSSADFLKGAVRRNIFPLMESHYEAELDEVLLRPIAPLNPTSPSPSPPPPSWIDSVPSADRSTRAERGQTRNHSRAARPCSS